MAQDKLNCSTCWSAAQHATTVLIPSQACQRSSQYCSGSINPRQGGVYAQSAAVLKPQDADEDWLSKLAVSVFTILVQVSGCH